MDSDREDAFYYTGTMNIGIDVREACRAQPAGKGMWTLRFVEELLSRNLRVTLFTDVDIPAEWEKLIDGHYKKVKVIQSKGIWWHLSVARFLRSTKEIQLYVSTTSYIVPFLLGASVRVIPIVHDLIAFRGERHNRKASLVERLTLGRTMKNAWKICTISQSTKEDLLKRYSTLDPNNVIPIFAAPVFRVDHPNVSEQHVILTIGTLCPRKNQLRLIEAYSLLPDDIKNKTKLILSGSRGWNDGKIIEKARTTPNVTWLQYVPSHELSVLLSTASVFVFPSLYEGFGLPILDAFAAHTPVVTSDRGSLREVAGDGALLVNPEDVQSISRGLLNVLTDQNVRSELVQRGSKQLEKFSWKRTVDLFMQTLEQ